MVEEAEVYPIGIIEDVKITFMTSPRQREFLEQLAREGETSISTIIRQLIAAEIKRRSR